MLLVKRAKRRKITRLSLTGSIAAAVLAVAITLLFKEPTKVQNVIAQETLINRTEIDKPTLITGGNVTALSPEITTIKAANNLELVNKGDMLDYQTVDSDTKVINNTLVTPTKSTYKVTLADGTLVTLNSQSSLTFPSAFKDSTRSVTLIGEAFFEVTKDTTKPFIVNINDVSVKVYGTTFNIKTTKDNNVSTTLLTGSVSMSKGSYEQFISPNEVGVSCHNSDVIAIREANTYMETAWMRGEFSYDKTPATELLHDMTQWYGVSLNYDEKQLEQQMITATYDKSLDLDTLIESVSILLDVVFIKTEFNAYDIE